MRHAAYLAALCVTILAAALCPGRACAEGKLDLGFEDVAPTKVPLQWRTDTSYPFDLVESVVKDFQYVRSGEASVKLVKKTDPQKPDARGHFYTNDDTPVQKEGRYVFSLWTRGDGKIGANAYAYGPVAGGAIGFKCSLYPQPMDKPTAAGDVTDKEWQQFRYEFDLSQSKEAISSVRLVILATGTVYVDDAEWTQAAGGNP